MKNYKVYFSFDGCLEIEAKSENFAINKITKILEEKHLEAVQEQVDCQFDIRVTEAEEIE